MALRAAVPRRASTARIVWSDWSYSLVWSTDHFSGGDTSGGTSVFTNAHQDGGTTYDADGNPLASVSFHLAEHRTIRDLPPAGPGLEDVVIVDFSRSGLTCK